MADGTSQLQQLLAKHGLDTGITEDPREATRRMLADLGIQLPQEEEEGWDIFQPVRTFFGAAGNIGGQLLGLADPQAYEEASKEVLGDLGYDAQSPWYERAEAAPGLGDVAAQMVPDEVRESMVGRAVGPAGRMIGNILGDPTTYTPFVLSRLGGLIARSVPTVAPALKTAALARQARQQKVAAGILDEAAAAADDLADANRIHQLVMSEGTAMKRLGYQTAEGLARGGDLAMGAAAGLAYGPQVVNAAWEGAKRIPEAETLGEGVVEGVNTTLMAGLAALMGKGMIDAATAARTIGAARSGKVLPEVDAQIADGEAQVRAAAEEVEPVVVEPFEPPTPEPITVPEGEPVVLPDGTVIRVPQERPMEAPPEGEPITLPEEGEPVAVPEPVAAPEPGVPLEARDIEPVETALIEPPERRDIMQRRPPPEGLTPEDLELLDLEAARRRLEEEPVLTDEQAAAEVEAAGREPGFVEATPEEVSARMDLAPELQPYAEFVENKDLGAALEARGLTLDEFQSMPHQARMEVLAGKAEPAPVEAPPAEPAPAPEPIEPAPTPEVTEPEVPVKAPPEPSEASDQQAAMVAAEEADEFAAGLDEAPPEPTVERAADTPTEPEPAQAPVPETVPEAVPEDPVGQALTQFDDGLSKHDTGQKAIRSIIEGRKSRGETAPSDPVHAAELQNVLDSREARKDLLGSLKDVPPNRVYPAVKKWLDNRLKKEERGTTTKSTEAAIGKATAEGAAEGLKAKQAKKATKKKAEPGAYEQGKALLEKAGLRYKEFAEGVMADATGALGLPHNQTAFKKYIDLREQGVTRSDAIAQLAKGGIPNLSRNRQTIRNLIKDYEKKLNEDALAKHGERVAKDIELEETPDARPPSAVDVGGLSVDHGRIQQRIPLRPDGMDADGFKSMLQAKKGEMVSMLEDYYRFALRRAEVKGQGAALPDRRLRAFAKNLGIVPKKGENIKRIIRKIGREFGITDDAHFSNLGDVAFVRRAAAQAAAGKFEIPGWKAERGELWRGENDTRVEVPDPKAKVAILREVKGPAEAKLDLLSMLDRQPEIDAIMVPDDVKGVGPIMSELPLRLDQEWMDAHPDSPMTRFVVDRDTVQSFEARDLVNPYNPREGRPLDVGLDTDIMMEVMNATDEVVSGLNAQLKKIGATPLTRTGLSIGTDLGSGTFHKVYKLNGTKLADGSEVALRAGYMPWLPMVTPEQQSLMAPVLGHGKLADAGQGGQPIFYTLHPVGKGVGGYIEGFLDKKGRLYDHMRKLFLTAEEGAGTSQYYDEVGHAHQWAKLIHENKLPPGISLQDWMDDMATLFDRADAADLFVTDFGPERQGNIRGNQTLYMKVGKDVDPNTVVRQGADGDYALVFSDPGTAVPNQFSRLNTEWEHLNVYEALAQKKAEGEPDRLITLSEQQKRTAHYQEDDLLGLDLGDDLIVANHDRRATDTHVARLGELGGDVAKAFAKITDDIVAKVNEDLGLKGSTDLFAVKFRGLTASPHLGGLYVEGKPARIFVNPVEAAAYRGTYAEAVDDMLYALFHEITHNKGKGHGKVFQTMDDYIRSLHTVQDNMDGYREQLRTALPEQRYNALRDELVPEFNAMRRDYGRPSWREEAVAQLSPRDAAGRTETRPGGRGRGTEAPARGGDGGVQPGGVVPRGGGFEAGQLRSPTPARRPPAKGRAEREGVGYGSGRGSRAEGTGYEGTVARVEELIGRDRKLDAESAKKLVDEFVTGHGRRLQPRATHEFAWETGTKMISQMTDDEVTEFLKGRKPGARGEGLWGPKDAAWNLTQFEDLSDRQRARMLLWGDLTKGHRKRDKVRRWEEVDKEVQEMLALDTPEKWALAFRKKGGGLRDSEVHLLRTIHSELAGRMFDAESRFTDAMHAGDADAVQLTWGQLQNSRASYYGAADKAANLLTESGRALAIARRGVRRLDPQLAFEEDLIAGLRERVKSRFRDPAEAEKITRKLFKEFMDAKSKTDVDPNAWADFYQAYRTMLASGKWDKTLEFYKAGLLGYSSRAANITSNALFRGVRYVEDAVASALDMVGSKLQGREREVFAGEAGVSALGMRRAFVEAIPKWIKDNKDAFMLRPENIHDALQKGGILEDMLQHPGAIGGKKGEFIRFAFKGLNADDQLAKHISATDHMYRNIYRRLRKGELKTKSGESYVQATERIFGDLRQNFDDGMKGLPFDQPKFSSYEKMFKAANEAAREDTFQKELGNMGRGVQSVLRNHPFMQIFVPFLRTPTNIAKETIKRTPLGLLEVAAKWKDMTPAEQMGALARPMTGTAIGAGVLALAMDGEITGGGPIDPEDREALRASGWQPYSIKVGNQWVSFQRFEPIAAIFGIAADAAEGMRNGDFDTWNTGAMRVMQSAAENITNKTFLAGLDGVSSAISHPNLFLGRFAKQMQGSMIPNSLGFVPVGHLARAIDPVFRQADPMTMDVWTRKIPWLSTTVEPQYGPTGEERKRGGTALERLASPFARWPMREGPEALGAEEIVRLSVAPSTPKRHMYSKGGVKVKLEPEERQQFALSMREATKVIGQRVMKDPNYLKLPDDEDDPRWRYGQKTKQDVLKSIFRKYRSTVTKRLRREIERRGRAQYREQRQENQGLGLG